MLATIAVLLLLILITLVFGKRVTARLIGGTIGLAFLGVIIFAGFMLLSSIPDHSWKRIETGLVATPIIIGLLFLILYLDNFLTKKFPKIGPRIRTTLVICIAVALFCLFIPLLVNLNLR